MQAGLRQPASAIPEKGLLVWRGNVLTLGRPGARRLQRCFVARFAVATDNQSQTRCHDHERKKPNHWNLENPGTLKITEDRNTTEPRPVMFRSCRLRQRVLATRQTLLVPKHRKVDGETIFPAGGIDEVLTVSCRNQAK